MKDSGFGSFLAGVVIGGLIGAALGLILAAEQARADMVTDYDVAAGTQTEGAAS